MYDGSDDTSNDAGVSPTTPAAGSNAAGAGGGGADQGPSAFVLMEEVLDQLQLLNYLDDMRKKDPSFKPLHQLSFVIPNQQNPIEQFHQFIVIMQWIMNDKLGIREFKVNEYDDPTTTATNIVADLRKLGLQMELTPAKLKKAYGEDVCSVLTTLLQMVLERQGFRFKKSEIPATLQAKLEGDDIALSSSRLDGDGGNEDGDDIEEIDDAAVEDDSAAGEGDDDESNGGSGGDQFYYSSNGNNLADANRIIEESLMAKKLKLVESGVSAEEWRLELEEVSPHLVLRLNADNSWQTRIESMQEYRETIDKVLDVTSTQLKRIADEIDQQLRKIEKREKGMVGDQDFGGLSSLLDKFKQAQQELQEKTKVFKETEENITAMSNEMNRISQELDEVKSQADELGQKVQDNTPLVNIKEALKRIKLEIRQMEMRTGILQRTVLQAKLKDFKSTGRAQALAGANASIFSNLDGALLPDPSMTMGQSEYGDYEGFGMSSSMRR